MSSPHAEHRVVELARRGLTRHEIAASMIVGRGFVRDVLRPLTGNVDLALSELPLLRWPRPWSVRAAEAEHARLQLSDERRQLVADCIAEGWTVADFVQRVGWSTAKATRRVREVQRELREREALAVKVADAWDTTAQVAPVDPDEIATLSVPAQMYAGWIFGECERLSPDP